ncbi:UNVERIFIED_CONTAM: hypothetical protein K2H54_070387 [Gekko kuhli]
MSNLQMTINLLTASSTAVFNTMILDGAGTWPPKTIVVTIQSPTGTAQSYISAPAFAVSTMECEEQKLLIDSNKYPGSRKHRPPGHFFTLPQGLWCSSRASP